ncbi:hypothetical protein DFH09DRAFT_1069082 [Mycena vulgaris]|nr:hypothetical protein DFH09DRAFT_1069082 [Mycena vulgaris]
MVESRDAEEAGNPIKFDSAMIGPDSHDRVPKLGCHESMVRDYQTKPLVLGLERATSVSPPVPAPARHLSGTTPPRDIQRRSLEDGFDAGLLSFAGSWDEPFIISGIQHGEAGCGVLFLNVAAPWVVEGTGRLREFGMGVSSVSRPRLFRLVKSRSESAQGRENGFRECVDWYSP